MEQSRLQRVFRLITLLIGNHRNTLELAELLETDRRNVQRDIVELKNVGFVVEYRNRHIPFLSANEGSLKEISDLVHFSKEEAYILHRAIESIGDGTALKQTLKRKLYNIYNYPWLADVVVKPNLSSVVHNLSEAMAEERCVVLKEYRSANSNLVSDRLVEPFRFTTNYEQVWCYDRVDEHCKLFKVARIGSVELLEKPWENKNKHIDTQIDVFRISGEKFVGIARLELNIRAFNLLTEEYPLAEQQITPMNENTFLFEAPVCSYEGVGRFVLGLFADIRVLGDEGLKHFLHQKISTLKI